MDNINFNFDVIKSKAYKHLKYFPMVFHFYKKSIPQRTTKLSGKMKLTVIYTFHMVNQILVE